MDGPVASARMQLDVRDGGDAGDACQRERNDLDVSNGMPSQRVGVCHNDDGRWWIGGGGKSDEVIRRWSERWIGWLSVESGGASFCEAASGAVGESGRCGCAGRWSWARKGQQKTNSVRASQPELARSDPSLSSALTAVQREGTVAAARALAARFLLERAQNARKKGRGERAGRGRGRRESWDGAACLALGPIRNPPGCNSKGRFQRQSSLGSAVLLNFSCVCGL